MAQSSVREAFYAVLLAVFAATFATATNTPTTAKDGPQESGLETSEGSYFYSPAEFLHICAQFPGLAACQQESGSLVEKRKSAYMRFGRSAPEEEQDSPAMEKRKSAYMRFGKRSPSQESVNEEVGGDVQKRKSAYMRFGKRKSAYMRFGKRSADNNMEKESQPICALENDLYWLMMKTWEKWRRGNPPTCDLAKDGELKHH
uniref:Uncharacterized protein n=1 Tax=Ditylenchus dipsaci TaxID=166011 RepID=A0A915EM04_9BILA